MLLRGLDERGLTFFTNRTSRKGDELRANPRAAVVAPLVGARAAGADRGRRRGDRRTTSRRRTGQTRPRGSQIAAWASPQSQPLSGRDELDARVAEAEERFAGGDVPLPPFWGGYRLVPDERRVLDAPRQPAPRPRPLRPRARRLAPRATRAVVDVLRRRERAVRVHALGVPEHVALRAGEPRRVDLRAHLARCRTGRVKLKSCTHGTTSTSPPAQRELEAPERAGDRRSGRRARILRARARPGRTATGRSSRTPCRGTAPSAAGSGRSRGHAPRRARRPRPRRGRRSGSSRPRRVAQERRDRLALRERAAVPVDGARRRRRRTGSARSRT